MEHGASGHADDRASASLCCCRKPFMPTTPHLQAFDPTCVHIAVAEEVVQAISPLERRASSDRGRLIGASERGSMERLRPIRHSASDYLDVVGVDQDDGDYGRNSDDNELLMRLQADASRADSASSSRGMQNESPTGSLTRPVIKRDRGAMGIAQKCSVCEVMTSGFHFGAVSCAACSAFFRRTVAENRVYNCRKEGDEYLKCPINQSARCYCRACRMQKCLNAGMDPSAVQPHRDVIGSKKRKVSDDEMLRANANGLGMNDGGETLADHLKMNREFSRAFKARSEYDGFVPTKVEKLSPTAHLLTSNSHLAEQLLAFSRQPSVITVTGNISSSSSPSSSTVVRQMNSHHHNLANVVSLVPHPNHMSSMAPVLGAGVGIGAKNGQDRISELHAMTASSSGSSIVEVVSKEEVMDDHHNQGSSMGGAYEYRVQQQREDVQAAESIDSSVERDAMRNSIGPESGAASMLNERFTCTPDPTLENWIESIVSSYERLRERRRLIYCPPTIRDILGGSRPVSSECREESFYDRIKDKMRVEIGLVAELLMSVPSFTSVSLEDQVLLFKNVSCYFNVLEKHYLTMQHGGVKLNRIIHTDLSYTDLNSKQFPVFRTDKDETMTDEMLVRLFIDPLKHSLHILAGSMEKMKMTDVEFCALVAVLLFDSTIAGLSETGRAIIAECKDRVYKDWFAYYRMQGRSRDDAAQRVGETILLIPAIQSTAELSKENFHLIRVFQIFDYDNLLDDVFNVGGGSSPNRILPEHAETDDAAAVIAAEIQKKEQEKLIKEITSNASEIMAPDPGPPSAAAAVLHLAPPHADLLVVPAPIDGVVDTVVCDPAPKEEED